MLCKNVFQKTNHAPIIPKSIVHDFGQSIQTHAVSACIIIYIYTHPYIYYYIISSYFEGRTNHGRHHAEDARVDVIKPK